MDVVKDLKNKREYELNLIAKEQEERAEEQRIIEETKEKFY